MFRKFSALNRKKSENVSEASVVNRYHCVEVKPSTRTCDAVLEIEGKKFLSVEAPALPLPGCNVYCSCRYVHFDDRRQKKRRDRFAANSIADKSVTRNRRLGGDRRRS